MATRTRYVRTSSAGGDGTADTDGAGGTNAYATLAAAIAAEAGNLGGDDLVIHCSVGSGSAADTSTVHLTGFSNGTVTVQAKTGERAGTQWSATIYRLVRTPAYDVGVFEVTQGTTVTISGLQIESGATAANRAMGIEVNGTASGVCNIIGCYVRHTGATGTPDEGGGISHKGSANQILRVRNTIIDGFNYGIVKNGYSSSATMVLYNFTAVGAYTTGLYLTGALDIASGAVGRFKNLILSATGNDYDFTGQTPTESLDIFTADATSPTSDGSKTFSFENGYALAAGSDGINGGTDLSADATWAFSDDIAGTTRSGTWDVGAFEYVASSAGALGGLAGKGFLAGQGGLAGIGGGLAGFVKIGNIFRPKRWLWAPQGA